jgi:hypothetical protein
MYPEKICNFLVELVENCMKGYIMVAQRREIGPGLRGPQREKEV